MQGAQRGYPQDDLEVLVDEILTDDDTWWWL